MEKVNCSICDKGKSIPYLQIPNKFFTKPSTFFLVKCKDCNFVYLNPRITDQKIKQYYNKEYSPYMKKNIFFRSVQFLLFRWKKFMIELYIKNGKILDVGSGENSFINYMNKFNWSADSYDKYNKSTIDDIYKCKENSYDVVTLWHSIEHIHNIDQLLIKIKKILKDNGLLFIACPNINSIDSNLLKSKWVAYDAPRHLYHFSPTTLSNLLTKFNFSIISYYRMYQDTFYNILASRNVNIFSKLFFLCFSLCIIIFFKRKSSSFLYICKLK